MVFKWKLIGIFFLIFMTDISEGKEKVYYKMTDEHTVYLEDNLLQSQEGLYFSILDVPDVSDSEKTEDYSGDKEESDCKENFQDKVNKSPIGQNSLKNIETPETNQTENKILNVVKTDKATPKQVNTTYEHFEKKEADPAVVTVAEKEGENSGEAQDEREVIAEGGIFGDYFEKKEVDPSAAGESEEESEDFVGTQIDAYILKEKQVLEDYFKELETNQNVPGEAEISDEYFLEETSQTESGVTEKNSKNKKNKIVLIFLTLAVVVGVYFKKANKKQFKIILGGCVG